MGFAHLRGPLRQLGDLGQLPRRQRHRSARCRQVIALIAVSPIGLVEAAQTLTQPLLLAGIGVGICSSVIPYVCDQLAMARIPRATFSLMLALLPATATAIGVLVLGQIPTVAELAGVTLTVAAVALHHAQDVEAAPEVMPSPDEPEPGPGPETSSGGPV